MKFDKHVSNMVKGIAIIFMLMHHLFTQNTCIQWGIDTGPFSETFFVTICHMMKICVRMFIFITAYGITISQNKMQVTTAKELSKSSVKRYVKLMIGFWFIYILAFLTVGFRGIGITDVYGTGMRGIIIGVTDALGIANIFNHPTLNVTWWYMEIAILLIFVTPVMVLVYKKIGFLMLVITAYINHMFGINDYDITVYLFCITLGIFCAEEQLFETMYKKNILKNRGLNSVLKMFLYICMAAFLFYLRYITNWVYWIDPIFTVMIGAFCMEMRGLLKGFSYIFEFLGKYSMNMFLVHTLIYHYYFTKFVYSFRNWFVITLVLLMISLVISVLCEKVKAILRVDRLMEKCEGIINRTFS